jgi:hypothetical protein
MPHETFLTTTHGLCRELLPLAVEVIGAVFEPYDPVPFGLTPADFSDFAMPTP